MFELLDRMSGPAEKINKALGGVGGAIKKLGGEGSGSVGLFGKGIQWVGRTFGAQAAGSVLRFSSAAVNLGEKLKPVGTAVSKIGSMGASAFSALGGAMLTVGAAAASVGAGLALAGGSWVAHFLTFKEDSIAAFKAMTGSKDAADRIFDKAVKFASKTPFKESDVVAMTQALATRGFKEGELDTLMKGVGDVGAMLGTEKMDSVINALGKMRANGKMTGETLQMLADAGINAQLVFDSLGKQLGKSKEQVQALMQAGKITDAQGIQAAMDAIANGMSGGKLGGAMEEKSKTITGLLSTLQGRPEAILAHANMEGLMEPFKAFLANLNDALDPDGPVAKRFTAIIEKIGNAFGELFGELNSGRDLKTTLGGVLNVIEPLVDAFGAFLKGGFKGLSAVFKPIIDVFVMLGEQPGGIEKLTTALGHWGEIMGFLVGAIIVGVGAIVGAWLWLMTEADQLFLSLNDFWNDLANIDWEQLGIDIVQGLIDGLIAMTGPLGAVVTGLSSVIKDTFTGDMEINSPSRVAFGWGGNIGQGLLNGLSAMTSPISTAVSALTGDGIQPATAGGGAVAAAGGSGGGNTMTFQFGDITFQVSGKDGEEVATKAAESFKAKLGAALKQLSLE
jgi:tape measure domain-containing protein